MSVIDDAKRSMDACPEDAEIAEYGLELFQLLASASCNKVWLLTPVLFKLIAKVCLTTDFRFLFSPNVRKR